MAVLTALAVVGLAGPALAEDCTRPNAPTVVDGATATMDQLAATRKEVGDFMAASDAYQSCVIADLGAQRDAAKAAKTKFDKGLEKAANAKISENQADKEKVGTDYNKAVKAFKAAHPS
jgi:hypothetical protein